MRRPDGARSRSPARRGAAAPGLVLIVALAGCAPAALQRAPSPASLPPAQETFDVTGRLSARHDSDGLAANFRWQHTSDRDELELVSPLGQTIALLTGDATGVRLLAADGRVSTAANWTALTEQGLGWPLPVDGLAFWMQGTARAGAAFSAEAGDDGRAAVLRQDGWTIVYQAYVQTPSAVWRPSRMTLTYPEVELRFVIDQWR